VGLFISERIRKREFGKLIPPAEKAALMDGARPELAQPLAGKDLPKGTRLLKPIFDTCKNRNHEDQRLMNAKILLALHFPRAGFQAIS
jgi:hypothetical protein